MATYVMDDAICLRVVDFSETSQIVGMFTRRHGMVPMIAKGAKRESKRTSSSGPLDLLTSGEVVFVPAKSGGELSLLSKWELVNHRTMLRKDLAALNGAMMGAEVTAMLMVPQDPHEALYEELEAMLELVGRGRQERMRGVVAYVKAGLVEAGYGPVLEACVMCGRGTGDEEVRFVPVAGGIVCPRCGGSEGVAVSGRIAVALERLPRPRVMAVTPPAREAEGGALAKAMEILLTQVEVITDKRVKTRSLMGNVFGVG
ncbi:MAG: DNA repair protein RecO [Phycisphaerales bacterium]|nr:DNA repair protein RecO [Phycisphaerales bacterium]